MIPTRKVFFNESKYTNNNIATKGKKKKILYRAVVLLWTGNEARRVDHRRAHPKVPLAPARGSLLILG